MYWHAWSGRVIVPFEPREAFTVPAHRTTFVARKSPIDTAKTNGHYAADPINALLNYAYRLAEIECRLACLGGRARSRDGLPPFRQTQPRFPRSGSVGNAAP
ncbi:hypothetical protein GCM10011581_25900 [Saccharopolyspora subtropica]|uniref:Uncharacterized protein n=1 Tax=Saccharopolyspora thermophila TaxID=89367 RepID=A0A917JXZ8_9PSEU|nr:hypothetical protein GCM10011581_25900 [Saccharopolyspora subtropica]